MPAPLIPFSKWHSWRGLLQFLPASLQSYFLARNCHRLDAFQGCEKRSKSNLRFYYRRSAYYRLPIALTLPQVVSAITVAIGAAIGAAIGSSSGTGARRTKS